MDRYERTNEFNKLLKKIKWTKRAFAEHTGVGVSTAFKWSSEGCPKWPILYLDCLIARMGI